MQLSAHTCFPSGRPWWKDSWRAAARPEAFSARPSVNVHARRAPAALLSSSDIVSLKCMLEAVITPSSWASHLCGLHMHHRGMTHFFFLLVFASFWVITMFIWGSCTFSQRVCAAWSTCMPVVWKGWELIALYIEVYVHGGLGLFGLDCARGAY